MNHPTPRIMGILNLTPDSFSDGGLFIKLEDAVAHGKRMVEEGAEIIDVGGESTRPGSDRVDSAIQIQRVVPVIEALKATLPKNCAISIDTTSSRVAEQAIKYGATIVNDISGGQDDPDMFDLLARTHVQYILMHMQGTPKTMQDNPVYDQVVEEILMFFKERIAAAGRAGVSESQIMLDPGIGFGKRREDNLTIIKELQRFVETGHPIVLGTSRKRFMGAICGETDAIELLGATVATTVWGALAGVQVFRVHDVKPNRQALDVTLAMAGPENAMPSKM